MPSCMCFRSLISARPVVLEDTTFSVFTLFLSVYIEFYPYLKLLGGGEISYLKAGLFLYLFNQPDKFLFVRGGHGEPYVVRYLLVLPLSQVVVGDARVGIYDPGDLLNTPLRHPHGHEACGIAHLVGVYDGTQAAEDALFGHSPCPPEHLTFLQSQFLGKGTEGMGGEGGIGLKTVEYLFVFSC